MKFTSEDLMKAMGLQVGDRISTITANGAPTIYDINKISGSIFYEKEGNVYSLINLIDREYEILPKPKRVGDLMCDCQSCANCPLRMIDCFDEFGNDFSNMTLYEILNFKNEDNNDQEIYDLLKARLDKEVEE